MESKIDFSQHTFGVQPDNSESAWHGSVRKYSIFNGDTDRSTFWFDEMRSRSYVRFVFKWDFAVIEGWRMPFSVILMNGVAREKVFRESLNQSFYLNPFFPFFCRFLTIVLCSTVASAIAQFVPPHTLDAIGSECALVLPGGARSSVYDHTLNLFRSGGL